MYAARHSEHSETGRPKRKRAILLVFAATIIIATGVITVWAMSGNKATITDSTPVAGKPVAPTYKTFDGKYVTFTYKGGYTVKTIPSQQPGVELAMLRADTTYQKQLALSVQPLPSGGMTADAGYNFRATHPNIYSSQQVTVDGQASTEWIKNDGTEQTIYIPHGNSFAVLAFSILSSNDTSALPAEVTALLPTFHWK